MVICILEMVNVILNRRGDRPPTKRASAKPPVFDGVKQTGWRAKFVPAREIGAALALRGEIAYWVGTPPECVLGGFREMRAEARERVRLRSAKLLDAAYRFLCECRICDRSLNGLKILLARNIAVPGRFAVHIDETFEVRGARMVWRRGLALGVRLMDPAPDGALRLSDRFALRERYYGVPD